MTVKTLFLAWQADRNQGWFPIGQLDADVEGSEYRFHYTRGAERAQKNAEFPLLMEFPYLREKYQSSELFPIFKNRLMSPKRPEFAEYLRSLDLSERADPIQILAANEGRRVTDSYEVFPKIEKREDGSFTCRFFLHGSHFTNQRAQDRIKSLKPEEKLHVALQPNNPATGLAVQIQTEDYYMIGWAPRYLVKDIAKAIMESHTDCQAHVVGFSPQAAPLKQRLLIELSGRWDEYAPMSGEDFQSLVD